MLDLESNPLKRLQQFRCGKEAQFVDLSRVSSARCVGDLILKMEAGEASINLRMTNTGHADTIPFTRMSENALWVERTGRKPRLNDDHALRRQVLTKTRQRSAYSIEGFEIADGTEQAQDGVVPTGEVEIAHIRCEELACRVFLRRNTDESRVEIQAIDDEALGSEKSRVLASATRNVKDRLALWVEST